MMTDSDQGDADFIRKAFVDPIRTVMLIDDRFPTLGAAVDAACGAGTTGEPTEWARAGRLWRGSRSRRWLCDIEHRHEWSADDIACIAGSDLIVLDYHLEGSEEVPANASRQLLRYLASHNHTNLVVVYTSREDLDVVRDEIVAGLRGHRDWKALLRTEDGRLEEAFNELLKTDRVEGAFNQEAYFAFCRNDPAWQKPLKRLIKNIQKTFQEAAPAEPWGKDWLKRLQVALAEHRLWEAGASLEEHVQVVSAGHRWIECGNVFVTLMTKPEVSPEDEIEPLMQQLDAALVEWSPSAMRAAVSLARAEVRRAGLQGEALSMPDAVLEAGWWYSMLTAQDAKDQRVRARQLAVDLLAGVGDVIADTVGEFIAGRAPKPYEDHASAMNEARRLAGVTERGGESDFMVGHALNAFLSCERHRPTRVGCGTILAISTEEQQKPFYVVTVSPACDMEPRVPNGSYGWLRGLHPWRPTLALVLTSVKKHTRHEALELSTISRWLFVEHDGKRLVFALRPNPKTEQLTHETLLVDLSEEETGAGLDVRLLRRAGAGPTLSPATAHIVAQLRAPFAEHVLTLAGQHLSRIGTDYFGVPPIHLRRAEE